MKLTELADQLTVKQLLGDLNVEITGISINSQQLRTGELFVCIPGIPGLQADRHGFIDDAVRKGAAALVVERDVPAQVPTIKVPDARYALALLAAHYYGYPSRELKLIGVTGTNGKTTTSHMIESIFGYAGLRTGLMGNIGTKIDRTKRPVMGAIAAKYSDKVIITSDNPRSEDPYGILEEIESGLSGHSAESGFYECIEDRRQAIRRAVELAGPGDIVLIAGKGHETYQILKDETVHFDDREEARAALARRRSVK